MFLLKQNYSYTVRNPAGVERTEILSPASTVSPINVTGLTVGEQAIIKIRAINSYGAGTYSSEFSVTPGAPAAPTITSITGVDSSLIVYFNPPASIPEFPITGYEYSLDSGATYIKVEGTTSPLTITGLINETTYSVQLRTVNSISNSAPSSGVNGKPTNLPSAPTITDVSTNQGITLIYFNPPINDGGLDIAGYKYSQDGGIFTSANSTTSPLSLSGLTVGETYKLYVRAFNISGDGGVSAAFSVTIGAPTAPTIDFVDSTATAVELTFTLPSDEGSPLLNIEYSLNGSSSWVPVNPAITEGPLILDSALTANTRYSIRLRATNAYGSGAPSNVVYVSKGLGTIPQIASIQPENGTLTLNILPPGNHTQPIVDYKYNVYTDVDLGVYTSFNASTFPITSLTIPIND